MGGGTPINVFVFTYFQYSLHLSAFSAHYIIIYIDSTTVLSDTYICIGKFAQRITINTCDMQVQVAPPIHHSFSPHIQICF